MGEIKDKELHDCIMQKVDTALLCKRDNRKIIVAQIMDKVRAHDAEVVIDAVENMKGSQYATDYLDVIKAIKTALGVK